MSDYECWPNLLESADMLGVKPRHIKRHSDFYDSYSQPLTPTEVLCLNGVFKRRSYNEVAAELIQRASTLGDGQTVSAEVEEFFVDLPPFDESDSQRLLEAAEATMTPLERQQARIAYQHGKWLAQQSSEDAAA